jgi:hypothetical protein
MTATLQLDWVDGEKTVIDTLSLLAYSDGFDLAENGWDPKVPTDRSTTLIEVLTLRVSATSADDLAAIVQQLDLCRQRVDRSRSVAETHALWFTVSLDEEAFDRRALVVGLDYALNESPLSHTVEEFWMLTDLTLTIERAPYWESTYNASTLPAVLTGLDTAGAAMFRLTNLTVRGDVPGRVSHIIFYGTTGTKKINQLWLGFRSSWHGTQANFVPTWGINLGTAVGSGEVAKVVDATTFAGSRTEIDFSVLGNTYLRRMMCFISSYTSNYTDQAGQFMVLLRAKVATSTGTAPVIRAGIGYGIGSSDDSLETRLVKQLLTADGDWHWYEMGVISFPPYHSTHAGPLVASVISLYAERMAGTAELHVDCFRLIPVDEGYLHLKFEEEMDMSNATRIDTDPLDNVTTLQMAEWARPPYPSDGYPVAIATPDGSRWGVPNDAAAAPYLVFAHENLTNGSELSLTLALGEYLIFERWRTLRGNQADPYPEHT